MEELQRISVDQEDDLLDSFVASMQVQGRSQKTIERYTYVIGRFMKFAKTPTRQINVYHIRNWIAAEKARGIQDSTLEGNRQVLSSYFGWLFRESLIEKNPVVNVGVIKVPKKQKRTYSDVDIEKLNRHCETIRDRAIVNFLRSTGCRISEMTGLNRDAVDLEALECVVHGKGNKERTVYMDAVAGMILGEYLKSRKDTCEALFAGKGGERLQPGGVRCMLKKLGAAAGVDHVHPHKFRRTQATRLARHGMPIQEVSAFLGHEKIDTTMRYVNVNHEDTKHDFRRYA
jgi:site-specific recombinase XerD